MLTAFANAFRTPDLRRKLLFVLLIIVVFRAGSQIPAPGVDVVGVDWRVPLDAARQRVGARALQGNLDPAICLAPWEVVEAETRAVLARNAGHPGHVFNLGHGVLPETDPDTLQRIVELVHAEGRVDA